MFGVPIWIETLFLPIHDPAQSFDGLGHAELVLLRSLARPSRVQLFVEVNVERNTCLPQVSYYNARFVKTLGFDRPRM